MSFFDRICETTSTTGTGTVTLTGAIAQHKTFASRFTVGAANDIEYMILDGNGNDWEIGYGTLATSTTIARNFVGASTNADAKISLSSNIHKIFCVFGADLCTRAQMATYYGSTTPTGGISGQIFVGAGKIWANDNGTWKSVNIA
jgi:hypothetical protein